jgi:nitroreductase
MSRLESLSDLPGGRAPTDDIWKAIYTQRAIRYWQDRPVPRELLQQVIEAASKAPSGSNTQPWIFVVVDDPAKLALIAAALRAFFENAEPLQDLIEKGQDSEDKTERLMLRGARAFFMKLERAPALVVPCLYQLSSPTPDPTSLLAGSSIYMAVQNLMLSARALGLGTVMTTAHALIEPDLRKALDLPSDAHPVALIPIGYPDANFGPTTRKGLEEILRWNAWT